MGFETFDNNRSTRIFELVESYDTVDYETFKTIKYDNKFPTPFNYNFMDINNIMEMDPKNYPLLSPQSLHRYFSTNARMSFFHDA